MSTHTRRWLWWERPCLVAGSICLIVYFPLALASSHPSPWWGVGFAAWGLQGYCVRWLWVWVRQRDLRRNPEATP